MITFTLENKNKKVISADLEFCETFKSVEKKPKSIEFLFIDIRQKKETN